MVTVLRKPIQSTVASNVLEYGTSGLNIDAVRVATKPRTTHSRGNVRGGPGVIYGGGNGLPRSEYPGAPSRFPANLIHNGSQEVLGQFPDQVSTSTGGKDSKGGMGKIVFGSYTLDKTAQNTGGLGDSGTPARFFYAVTGITK